MDEKLIYRENAPASLLSVSSNGLSDADDTGVPARMETAAGHLEVRDYKLAIRQRRFDPWVAASYSSVEDATELTLQHSTSQAYTRGDRLYLALSYSERNFDGDAMRAFLQRAVDHIEQWACS